MYFFLKLFIWIVIAVGGSLGTQLKCEYIDGSEYCCRTLDIFTESVEVSSITGDHLMNYKIKDVEKFSIGEKSESKFVPTGICKKLRNLKAIEIVGMNIREISRDTFSACENIGTVQITGTQISWLNEGVFEFLTNIRNLVLNKNRLRYLPANLIKQNSILTSFSVKDNLIEIIELKFGGKLLTVNLLGNKCVDEFVIGFQQVKELNAKINYICASTKQKLILDGFHHVAEKGLKLLNDTGVDMTKTVLDDLTIVTSDLVGKNFTDFMRVFQSETLTHIQNLTQQNHEHDILMENLLNENLGILNKFSDLNKTTTAQKRFINELLVNITILNKLRLANQWTPVYDHSETSTKYETTEEFETTRKHETTDIFTEQETTITEYETETSTTENVTETSTEEVNSSSESTENITDQSVSNIICEMLWFFKTELDGYSRFAIIAYVAFVLYFFFWIFEVD